MACPCGSGAEENVCCGALIAGAPAPTALALMRSRYTAYVRGAVDYLVATHAAHEALDRENVLRMSREKRWSGLTIHSTERGGPADDEGVVEFTAYLGTQPLHERSIFRRIEGKWLYVDADRAKPITREKKPGRNDPCPCGSGKKYKKCHGA